MLLRKALVSDSVIEVDSLLVLCCGVTIHVCLYAWVVLLFLWKATKPVLELLHDAIHELLHICINSCFCQLFSFISVYILQLKPSWAIRECLRSIRKCSRTIHKRLWMVREPFANVREPSAKFFLQSTVAVGKYFEIKNYLWIGVVIKILS